MSTLSLFKVVDRRKEKAEAETEVTAPVAIIEPVASADKGTWEEVKYGVAFRPAHGGVIILGRAMGLRSDGLPFIADYWFSADWDDNRDWEAQSKKRLDTFLNCDCNSHAPCAIHKMYFDQWLQQDTQRLTLAGTKPVPKVLEILHKAELARRANPPNLAVPGR